MADTKVAADSLRVYQQILADAGFFQLKREIVLCENSNGQLIFDQKGVLNQRWRESTIISDNGAQFTYPVSISYEEASTLYDFEHCAKNILAALKSVGKLAASNRQHLSDGLETIRLVVEANKQLKPKTQ